MGRVVSVNVGAVRTVAHRDRQVATGIFKEPVEGRVRVRGVNLDGDDHADRRAHGGPERAVYAYATEDLQWWEIELGRSVPPGTMGENLSVSGIEVNGARVGERWRIGTAVLEASGPRVPCFKLVLRMGDGGFPRRFAAADRPGAYFRIVKEGDIGAGDEIEVICRPDHDITVGLVAHAFHHDSEVAGRLLEAPALGDDWRGWAQRHWP